MVIDKYEIVDEYPSENEGYYFVKVKYFCKRGIAAGSFGPWRIKTEGPFVSIPCDSFLKYLEEPAKTSHLYKIKCPQCPEEFEEPAKTLEGFDTENEIHRVTFELIKDNGEWKIDLPIVFPHISEETLKKHLESFKETK